MSTNDNRTILLSSSLTLPLLNIGLAYIEGVNNANSNTVVRQLEADVTARAKQTMTLEALKDDPIIRSYRDFYWRFVKVDPTKTRPAAEALIRRVLQGKTIPQISVLVDTYNLLSIETRVSFGGYDASKLTFPLILRHANDEELFYGIGKEQPFQLSKDMLVLADQRQPLCIYPYRDAEQTRIVESTKHLLLMAAGAPGIPASTIRSALEESTQQIIRVAGGHLELSSVTALGV